MQQLGGTRDPSVDQGWAWVIAVAVCVINVISLGSLRCLGILVNNASVEFNINKRDSSAIFSVTYITFMLSSILFIALTRFVSCRVLIFIGGLLTSGGLCFAYFLPTPAALTGGTAVLLGLGLSASQSPSVLLLNQYFDRYRSRANGIAFAGGPVGSFLVPPLLAHLMLAFAFRGAMLLWGGLALHVCALACLLRPKPPPPPQSPLPLPPVCVNGDNEPDDRGGGSDNEDSVETSAMMTRRSPPDPATDAELAVELTIAASPRRKRKPDGCSCCADAGDGGAAMCGPEAALVFRRPIFYALGCMVSLGLCGLTLSFYIVPLHGREIGLDSTTTSLVLLLQGVPDLVSRLLAGFITDKRLLSHLRLMWLCLLGQSAMWFMLLATPNYAGLLAFAVGCGLFGGVVMAGVHPLAIGYLGLTNYRIAFATYSIVHGVLLLCLPILLGHIFDRTKTWRNAIALVGCLILTSGVIGLLVDLAESARRMTQRTVGRIWAKP